MKRKWKILLGVCLVLVLALGIASWYLSRHWKPILHDRLQIVVSASSDSLYSLTYDEFDFSWYSGHAFLTNVSLTPNADVYERLKAQNRAPDNQYTINIKSIKLRNFHPRMLYRTQKLNINEILIEEPSVLIVNEDVVQDSLLQKEKKTPYQQISKFLKEIRVDALNVNNLNFTYQNKSTAEQKETKLKNVNISVQDFLIDSLSQTDTSRIYYSSGVDFKIDNYTIATRDSMYHINLKNIDFSTSKKHLKVNRVEMKPRYNKADFYKVIDKPTDRFDIAFDSLAIDNINISQLLKHQQFHASKISSQKGFILVYNNANFPRAKKQKVGKDPHQQLQTIAWNFKIDTLHMPKTNIAYEELSKVSQQIGKVSFNKSDIQIFNITNDSASITRDSLMRMRFRTRFMNVSPLEVNMQFDLTAANGAFKYQGKLNAINGRALNPVLKPLAQVEVSSARIRSLDFSFDANEKNARGTVDFRYSDLKLNLLKLEEDGSVSTNKIVSTLANNFIINSSNPLETGEYIKARLRYKRPATESFFKFIWKSIFQGIKTSAGIDEAREARLMNRVSGTKQAVEDTKKAAKKVGGFIKGIFEKKEEE